MKADKKISKVRRYEVEKMRSCSNAVYESRIKGKYPSRASGRTVARGRFISIGDRRNRRTLLTKKHSAERMVHDA